MAERDTVIVTRPHVGDSLDKTKVVVSGFFRTAEMVLTPEKHYVVVTIEYSDGSTTSRTVQTEPYDEQPEWAAWVAKFGPLTPDTVMIRAASSSGPSQTVTQLAPVIIQ